MAHNTQHTHTNLIGRTGNTGHAWEEINVRRAQVGFLCIFEIQYEVRVHVARRGESSEDNEAELLLGSVH
jgi:hypothetical protein